MRSSQMAFGLLLCTSGAASAAPVPYTQLSPNAYQSFVGNWRPSTAPLCAALTSKAGWDKVMHPAPTMTRSKAFAPPDALWKHHAVLLLAQVIPGGDTSDVFRVAGVTRDAGALDVAYRFKATAPASFSIKWYMAVSVEKPLPPLVRFLTEGRAVCTVRPDSAESISPPGAG